MMYIVVKSVLIQTEGVNVGTKWLIKILESAILPLSVVLEISLLQYLNSTDFNKIVSATYRNPSQIKDSTQIQKQVWKTNKIENIKSRLLINVT